MPAQPTRETFSGARERRHDEASGRLARQYCHPETLRSGRSRRESRAVADQAGWPCHRHRPCQKLKFGSIPPVLLRQVSVCDHFLVVWRGPPYSGSDDERNRNPNRYLHASTWARGVNRKRRATASVPTVGTVTLVLQIRAHALLPQILPPCS